MIVYIGKVKSTCTSGLYVRNAPDGAIIGKLTADTAIQGKGELVLAGNYNRMLLTYPIQGWVASEYLDFTKQIITDVPEQPSQKIYVKMTPDGETYEYILAEG